MLKSTRLKCQKLLFLCVSQIFQHNVFRVFLCFSLTAVFLFLSAFFSVSLFTTQCDERDSFCLLSDTALIYEQAQTQGGKKMTGMGKLQSVYSTSADVLSICEDILWDGGLCYTALYNYYHPVKIIVMIKNTRINQMKSRDHV